MVPQAGSAQAPSESPTPCAVANCPLPPSNEMATVVTPRWRQVASSRMRSAVSCSSVALTAFAVSTSSPRSARRRAAAASAARRPVSCWRRMSSASHRLSMRSAACRATTAASVKCCCSTAPAVSGVPTISMPTVRRAVASGTRIRWVPRCVAATVVGRRSPTAQPNMPDATWAASSCAASAEMAAGSTLTGQNSWPVESTSASSRFSNGRIPHTSSNNRSATSPTVMLRSSPSEKLESRVIRSMDSWIARFASSRTETRCRAARNSSANAGDNIEPTSGARSALEKAPPLRRPPRSGPGGGCPPGCPSQPTSERGGRDPPSSPLTYEPWTSGMDRALGASGPAVQGAQ